MPVAPPADESRVTRRVAVNQALWTAGYSLTSGGFLVYFGKELGATGFVLALLLVVPETAATFGLLSRWVIQRVGNRKRVFLRFSVIARVASLGIPVSAFVDSNSSGMEPLHVMVALLAVVHVVQSIAYLSYLSWLSDLVTDRHWGRFFSIRNIAKLGVLLVVPVVAGYLRDWWRRDVSADVALWAYVAAFGVGTALQLVSLLPMLKLPDVPVRAATAALPEWRLLKAAFRDRSMRFLLIHNWWLALANGLTQAAFFLYLFGPLGVGLGTFYVLLCVMRIVKIPVSWITGGLCDRYGHKGPLFWGVLAASCAMPFWLLATPSAWWWVFGAYATWGAFAAANIAGRNLALELAPRSDNTPHLGLFRLIGGLLAGLSGLLGGLWLDQLKVTGFGLDVGGYELGRFQLLFAVSWAGRISAAFWLLPVREERRRVRNEAETRFRNSPGFREFVNRPAD
ncbi:MAG: MFS transporter [Planctomycetaceae bacterium]